ncbi:translesion error-prone DNA polymerase V autoproteolytic subunit [Shewanella xiamenensis]|uniref:translesion error-prone DNA polymerase V autoproteolytic subunit n=1 Tax=Shewanella xiamenensis TaxID=332186 RepID=UPI003F1BB101
MSVSLIGRSGALAFIKAKRLRIPLFMERVSAGFPSPAQDYVEQTLDLNELCIKRPAATFFVRVEGDSMIDAGIHPDDILVVDRSVQAEHGDIVIAGIYGPIRFARHSIAILRRVHCTHISGLLLRDSSGPDGYLLLLSLSSLRLHYEPMPD